MIRLIFGCGYLGLRVAEIWKKNGDSVYAITRSDQRANRMRELGINPVVADITQPETFKELPKADTVLVAVGMDRSMYTDIRMVYVDGLRNVLENISDSTKQLIYISSTGVYGDHSGDWIDEETTPNPVRDGGKACVEAEQLIAASRFQKRSTILRFAGIYGPDRVPTKNLIQSKDWKKLSANGYLNLIHVDDGARIVETVSQHTPAGETYLVSDGNPPLRKEYYQYIAQQFGVDKIPWEESEVDPKTSRSGSSKRIANRKLTETFKIKFNYPNFRVGLKQALQI